MATSVVPRAGLAALLLSVQGVNAGARPAEVPIAYQLAAHRADVPSSVLFALALQESGTKWNGRLVPWPWTLNVAGTPARYPGRREACHALLRALREGTSPVDVGLAQISVSYHRDRVRTPCELLDPYRNLALAGAILREQHEAGDAWAEAVGRYHRPAGGEPAAQYRSDVERHLSHVVGARLASSMLHTPAP